MRLVVDREAEVQAFNPVEYWTVQAAATGNTPPTFPVKLALIDGKKAELADEKTTEKVVNEIKAAEASITALKKRKRQRKPTAPFITSRLQQDAARALRFSAKKTMAVAQSLYQGKDLDGDETVGLITYMRTDSTRISDEAMTEVRQHIDDTYGKEYLPDAPNIYKTRKVRRMLTRRFDRTSITRTPESIKSHLSKDELKLYKLISERFVACQMANARFDQTSLDISAGPHTLRATGSVQTFAGFLKVYEEQKDEDDQEAKQQQEEKNLRLPVLEEGEKIKLDNVEGIQHFTQPPPWFSEASLVKELEERGIGRPSTYAAILSTIQDKDS